MVMYYFFVFVPVFKDQPITPPSRAQEVLRQNKEDASNVSKYVKICTGSPHITLILFLMESSVK